MTTLLQVTTAVFLYVLLERSSITNADHAPHLSGYDHMVNFTNFATTTQSRDPKYFVVYYSISHSLLHVAIICDSGPTGWCAFGISPNGNMVRSDVVVGWVDPSGNALVSGLYLAAKSMPEQGSCTESVVPNKNAQSLCPQRDISNCKDNALLVGGHRNGTYMTIEYTRPIAAFDPCDIAINDMGGSMNYVIFAIGPASPCASNCSLEFPYNIKKHSHRAPSSGILLNFEAGKVISIFAQGVGAVLMVSGIVAAAFFTKWTWHMTDVIA